MGYCLPTSYAFSDSLNWKVFWINLFLFPILNTNTMTTMVITTLKYICPKKFISYSRITQNTLCQSNRTNSWKSFIILAVSDHERLYYPFTLYQCAFVLYWLKGIPLHSLCPVKFKYTHTIWQDQIVHLLVISMLLMFENIMALSSKH